MAEKKMNANVSEAKTTGATRTATRKRSEPISSANGSAREKAQAARDHTKSGAGKAAAHTESAARSTADTAKSVGGAGLNAGRTAARKVAEGGQSVVAVSKKTVKNAATVWTLVKARRVIVAGTGAAVATGVTASYAAGRVSAKRHFGPVTRWTKGRL